MTDIEQSAHRSGNYDRRSEDVAVTRPKESDTSKHNDIMAAYTPEQIERGRKVYARFLHWLEENPRAYQYAESIALKLCDVDRRFGANRLVEAIRAHDFTSKSGAPTKTNNSFAPLIARTLVSKHPELRDHVKLRTCIYDVLLGE